MAPPISLFSVEAILIMSVEDSTRVYGKYYNPPHENSTNPAASLATGSRNPYPRLADQQAFERGLLEKTVKSTNDVILYDNRIVVFKTEGDVMLYVVGGPEENELLLYNVVLALRDSLALLLHAIDKRGILENYDLVTLCIDEIVDDGIILETDPLLVSSRVSHPPQQDINMKSIDFSEQGLLNAFEFGKRRLAEQLRQL